MLTMIAAYVCGTMTYTLIGCLRAVPSMWASMAKVPPRWRLTFLVTAIALTTLVSPVCLPFYEFASE